MSRRGLTKAEKVAEFNRIAGEINKNLAELAKEMPESKMLERYRGEFQPITTENPNLRAVNSALRKARAVYESGAVSLDSERRSVAGAIDTLKKKYGIDYVNKRNFGSFFRFLDDARARGLGSLYSSEQIITAVREAKQKGLNKRQIQANIKYWADKLVKYDEEGKVIEPDEYKPLKVITGKRLENYRAKIRKRARKEAKGDY